MEDGALALDLHDLWEETPPSPGLTLLQTRASEAASELQKSGTSVTVPRMPSPRAPGQARRTSKARATARRRARRIAGLIVISIALVVTFLLTAFGSGSSTPTQTRPAPANRLLPAGQPRPQVVALRGSLRLQLPIDQSRVTAIGYHAAGSGALSLQPVGRQRNEGLFARMARKLFGGADHGLTYYQLGGNEGPSTASLDVGASVGTDVYSPVDGTIVGVTPYTLRGMTFGARIDIQPTSAPGLVVRLTHLRPDPALTVGSSVAAAISKVGTIIDFSQVEKQALARYTQDAGNHVSAELHPAASLALP
jgi:murein DD-endopeptidase MepM/ murein hydrolase activator NlpD